MNSLTDAVPFATLIVGDDPNLAYKALSDHVGQIEALVGTDVERMTFQSGECRIEDVVSSWTQNFMFSSRAIIILRTPSKLLAEEVEVLLRALEAYRGDNFLILFHSSGELSKNLRSYFSKHKSIVELSLRKKDAKLAFLENLVADLGLKLDRDAKVELLNHLGEDISRAQSVLGLVKAREGAGANVSRDVVIQYLAEPGDVLPWDFTDAIEAGQVGRSVELLWRLMRAGDRHPLVILAILQRRLVELAIVADCRNVAQAMQAMKIRDKNFKKPEFVVKKIFDVARGAGSAKLRQAFVWMSIADRQLKGEGDIPPDLAVELLVARLARSFARAPSRP